MSPKFFLSSLSGHKAPQEALAKSVLAEVPGQLVDFFNTMKLLPPNSNNPAAKPTGPI